MTEVKICPVCGRKFCDNRKKYCTHKCMKRANYLQGKERKEKLEKEIKEKEKKSNALELIAKAAKEAGMTYGQYVAQHNA